MVSFQCHACDVVVKKSKLDQHRMRCHSGYDCINCSKTFNSPAEYKGHTSCISEAEKYQTRLYKGPKTRAASAAAPKNSETPKAQKQTKLAVPERQSNAQWNYVPSTNGNNRYQGGRGGGYGGGYGRGYGSGANDTPLGTSTGLSPFAQPALSPVPAANTPANTNGGTVNGHQKNKKRKADDLLVTSNKKARNISIVESLLGPFPDSSTEELKKEKKSKKDKKDKDAEKVKKKKKSKSEDGDVETAAPSSEEEKKKKKKEKKEKKAQEEAAALEANGEESSTDKKKKKKKKDASGAEGSTSSAQEGVEVNGHNFLDVFESRPPHFYTMSSWPGSGWHGPPPRYMQLVSDHIWQQHSPQGWYSADAYRLQVPVPVASPSATNSYSPKYPNLNPILAEDTTLLRFDVKIKPTSSSSILTSIYNSHQHHFALAKPTTHIRLISKGFPWQIDIVSHTNITCEAVWNSLYSALQDPIADSEWGFIIGNKDLRETIESSVKRRMDKDKSTDKCPLRIDYLGDATLFSGLEKDDDYTKLRLLPHSKKCDETWVVKLME